MLMRIKGDQLSILEVSSACIKNCNWYISGGKKGIYQRCCEYLKGITMK